MHQNPRQVRVGAHQGLSAGRHLRADGGTSVREIMSILVITRVLMFYSAVIPMIKDMDIELEAADVFSRLTSRQVR